MGERTCAFEITWMRKMSARRGRQSWRKERKMRFSPFWLKMRMPESIVEERGDHMRLGGLVGGFAGVLWSRDVLR